MAAGLESYMTLILSKVLPMGSYAIRRQSESNSTRFWPTPSAALTQTSLSVSAEKHPTSGEISDNSAILASATVSCGDSHATDFLRTASSLCGE